MRMQVEVHVPGGAESQPPALGALRVTRELRMIAYPAGGEAFHRGMQARGRVLALLPVAPDPLVIPVPVQFGNGYLVPHRLNGHRSGPPAIRIGFRCADLAIASTWSAHVGTAIMPAPGTMKGASVAPKFGIFAAIASGSAWAISVMQGRQRPMPMSPRGIESFTLHPAPGHKPARSRGTGRKATTAGH